MCAVSWTEDCLFATKATDAQPASEGIPGVNKQEIILEFYIFRKAKSLSMRCVL